MRSRTISAATTSASTFSTRTLLRKRVIFVPTSGFFGCFGLGWRRRPNTCQLTAAVGIPHSDCGGKAAARLADDGRRAVGDVDGHQAGGLQRNVPRRDRVDQLLVDGPHLAIGESSVILLTLSLHHY